MDQRMEHLLEALERMMGGELHWRIPISPAHDEWDALCHAVNVLAGELDYAAADLRRAKEGAEEANRAKTLFLRNVSHEIRTPLSAILSITEVLRLPGLDASRREELYRRILSNGRLLVGLVDDLLDFSKVESGKIVFDLQPLTVLPLLVEVVANLESEAQLKGLRLTVDSVENVDDAVIADDKRVRQILFNLVGNAIKFTEQGEVRVRLSGERAGAQLCVDVSDTGIGLSPSQGDALFEPFAQADAGIAPRFGGSGLGLALSRRLARAMGGDLVILDGAPGQGTTLRLTLPAWSSALAPSDLRAARIHSDGQPPGLRGARLLLAEDNPDVRGAMAQVLAVLGATVVEAADGEEAVERGTREPFDVVLMDIRMPRLDGLSATRRLRERGVRVPIVALTADAVHEQRDACLAAGCTTHLAKPVEVGRLAALICELWRP
jgi:signal transduction histidine kinase/CheY-like chemotaxis protein